MQDGLHKGRMRDMGSFFFSIEICAVFSLVEMIKHSNELCNQQTIRACLLKRRLLVVLCEIKRMN